ncbi:efflux RND transporter permease subunit [Mucilaginibacter sp. UYCu711]|uniref:efflux RND transporter permease subunit n=1 Tax=Mucilaginibacter sp. UYCu711 TaxID=3156339 RepID=UPI003D1A4D28
MNKISSFTIIMLFVCAAIIGCLLLPFIPVKLFPDKKHPVLNVSYSMPMGSPRSVEMAVTSKLEGMFSRIKGIVNISSTSANGWGSIQMELDKHTEVDAARFEASSIIRQAWEQLPQGISYPTLTMDLPDGESMPFMQYAITSNKKVSEINSFAEKVIKKELRNIPGIYDIQIDGSTTVAWECEFDYRQLQSMDIDPNSIKVALGAHFTNDFLGLVTINEKSKFPQFARILVTNPGASIADIRLIDVYNRKKIPVKLGDITKITHVEDLPDSYYRSNGRNAINISITAEPSYSQLKLSTAVNNLMHGISMKESSNYSINLLYDSSKIIRSELVKVYYRMGLTILCLLVFVFLIRRSVYFVLLIFSGLFITFFISFIFYYLFKLEIHSYSLIAITISLSLVIDNVIITSDHFINRKNNKIFASIFTTGLTSVSSLSLIFLQKESVIENLSDTIIVIVINIIVSIFVVVYFVPAFISQFSKKTDAAISNRNKIKRISRFRMLYKKLINLLIRRRRLVLLVSVLIFGIPFFLMPDELMKGTFMSGVYNNLFNNNTFKKQIKPKIATFLGGSINFFHEKVTSKKPENTPAMKESITIMAKMPPGSSIQRISDAIGQMERFLYRFDGVEKFETSIYNNKQAVIVVKFTKSAVKSRSNFYIKNRIIDYALSIGGGSWTISGLDNQVFTNDIQSKSSQYAVKLLGYNYDDLFNWADTLRTILSKHERVKRIFISPRFMGDANDYDEIVFKLDKFNLAYYQLSPSTFFGSVFPIYGKRMWMGKYPYNGHDEPIYLKSRQADNSDLWAMEQDVNVVDGHSFKLGTISTIGREQMPQEIVRWNQQYQLILQFDYLGVGTQAGLILKQSVEQLNQKLPLGFSAEKYLDGGFDFVVRETYFTIFLLIIIMYFSTGILFNSIKQSIAIILTVPASYIGIFITFCLFDIQLDKGILAALFILTGITVNSGIYLIDEYNRISKQRKALSFSDAYSRAWNFKIAPIMFTMISTLFGFIPFLVFGRNEEFWFSFAACSIGGLITAILALTLFLPLFLKK